MLNYDDVKLTPSGRSVDHLPICMNWWMACRISLSFPGELLEARFGITSSTAFGVLVLGL